MSFMPFSQCGFRVSDSQRQLNSTISKSKQRGRFVIPRDARNEATAGPIAVIHTPAGLQLSTGHLTSQWADGLLMNDPTLNFLRQGWSDDKVPAIPMKRIVGLGRL